MISEKRKKIVERLSSIFKKNDTIEIPLEWITPNTDSEVESNPVAVESSIVYDAPPQKRFGIRVPPLLGFKRAISFFLLIGCVFQMFSLAFKFPSALLMYIPAFIIFLDYLLKTHPKRRGQWYREALDDMEDEL